jgi:hypothetical protein
MATENLPDEFHRVRVKLYESYLPETKGKFLAKTDNEKTLSAEDVCAALKQRGGFTGSYEDMVEHVKLFCGEVGYQLCDGFAVNVGGLFSLHPHVGGTFDKLREGVTPDKHPVEFRFRVGRRLHDLAEHIEIYVEGLADAGAFIDEFLDVKTGLVNQKATIGGQFILLGSKIKIFGTLPKLGVWFTTPGSPAIAVGVSEPLAVNEAHRIIGIIPELLPGKPWTIEVRTQFTNSSTMLKEMRTIASGFTVSV